MTNYLSGHLKQIDYPNDTKSPAGRVPLGGRDRGNDNGRKKFPLQSNGYKIYTYNRKFYKFRLLT